MSATIIRIAEPHTVYECGLCHGRYPTTAHLARHQKTCQPGNWCATCGGGIPRGAFRCDPCKYGEASIP